jgi:RNA polymerase sigma factor (sigma-70 family)
MAIAAVTREGPRTHPFALLGDERLARLAAAGHERAFTVMYKRYHQPLYRYCRSILRDDSDAQDALQSTFAAAFAALARGQRDAPIRPWLFRIAHNEAISLLRRRRPTADLSAASGAWTASTEDQVAERTELRTLLHDLDRLTERQRSALVMRELSGLSHEEIATALGTSVGTAKQTIYEARRSIFQFAEGRAMPCDEVRRAISDADGRALRGRRIRAHLRECSACAEFAAAIPARGADLRVLAPALPPAAAAGLLQHVAGAGSSHAAGSGVAGLVAAAAGKTASAALTANALAGFAAVAGATVGVTVGVGSLVHTTGRGDRLHTVAPAVTPALAAPLGRVRSNAQAVRNRPTPNVAGATSATVVSRSAAAARVSRTPSRATRHAGGSRSTSTMTPAPGVRAGTKSGVAIGASPGNSANAPGHSATSPGNSARAPGHDKSGTATPATRPGNSANAPGHNKSAAATPATSPGNSATAPGHVRKAAPTAPATTVAPPASTAPATPVAPPASTSGSAEPPPKKHPSSS